MGCGPSSPPPTVDGGEAPAPCADYPTKAKAGGCLRDADCDTAGDRCRLAEADTPDDDDEVYLTCGTDRGGGEDGDVCVIGADCASGLCLIAGTCAVPCAGADECGDDARCDAAYFRVSTTANGRGFACIRKVKVGAGIAMDVAGRSDFFAKPPATSHIDVPSVDDHGLAIVVPACGIGFKTTALVTKDDPEIALFSATNLGIAEPPVNPLDPSNVPLALLLPSGSEGTLSDSGYTLSVLATKAGGGEVVSLTGAPTGNVFDLDLFYVGGRGWAREGDRGPPDVEAALTIVADRFAEAGLVLGEVRQHDVVGALQDRFSTIERADDGRFVSAMRLFQLSAGTKQPSIAVFFVKFMDSSLGLSGGTPGPAGMSGTPTSGVVLAVDLIPQASGVGPALAHELGHYMGLFHTTEPNGRVIESIADTPICPVTQDADDNGFLVASECADFGADNVMFWQGTGTEFSPQQVDVLTQGFVLRDP